MLGSSQVLGSTQVPVAPWRLLQRTIGNQAMLRLLAQRRSSPDGLDAHRIGGATAPPMRASRLPLQAKLNGPIPAGSPSSSRVSSNDSRYGSPGLNGNSSPGGTLSSLIAKIMAMVM
jgi:hypothetical protein